jgi:hypothetical protein
MRAAAQLMWRRWWLGVLVVGALIAIRAETKAQPAAPSGDDALVHAADESLGAAMRAADKSSARRLLSLQFTFVDATGKVHERKEFLAGLKDVAPGLASDPKVRIYGRIGMVTGSRKSAAGKDVFFLDIWAKEKGAWRALVAQDVVLAAKDSPKSGSEPPDAAKLRNNLSKLLDCKNPCETIPYRVRSPVEQDIINTFQAIEKAVFTRDADEYAKHMADEFVHYRSEAPPTPKAERIANIAAQKKANIPPMITAIQSMRLWAYGDGAAMISANGAPDDAEPLLRIARVWVKRNGQWQMAISVQTDVANP